MEFFAYLVMCSFMEFSCTGLKDNRGPYPTVTECQDRLQELKEDLGSWIEDGRLAPDTKFSIAECRRGSHDGPKVEGAST